MLLPAPPNGSGDKGASTSGGAAVRRKEKNNTGLCYAFQKGECSRGGSCKYLHEAASATDDISSTTKETAALSNTRPAVTDSASSCPDKAVFEADSEFEEGHLRNVDTYYESESSVSDDDEGGGGGIRLF